MKFSLQIPYQRKSPWTIFHFLTATFLGIAIPTGAQSQEVEAASGTDNSGAKIEVFDSGWSDTGQLVLGVRISAPKSHGIALGRSPSTPDGAASIFTTKQSSLTDLYTGATIPASNKYPRTPGFGLIKTAEIIPPGESLVFTVAFPRPPEPPMQNGKRADYSLRLQLPGNLPSVEFKIPYRPPPGAVGSAATAVPGKQPGS